MIVTKLVSWFITYLRDLQPTYTGVTIHLLSAMDIPACLPIIWEAKVFFRGLGEKTMFLSNVDSYMLEYSSSTVANEGLGGEKIC